MLSCYESGKKKPLQFWWSNMLWEVYMRMLTKWLLQIWLQKHREVQDEDYGKEANTWALTTKLHWDAGAMLGEVKHKQESSLQHLEPLALGRHPHNTLCWENLRAATAETTTTTGYKPACETFYRPYRWMPCVTWKYPRQPGKNQHSPWADWPTLKKTEW
jgi:hypothetical protein